MGKSPVLGAAFGIFAVWWLVSLVAYLVTGKVWTGGGWIESSARAWAGLLSGALVGTTVMATLVMVARQWKLASMAGDDVRGVRCSIGQLPMHVVLPPMADEFPDKTSLKFPPKKHDPENKLNVDWMDEWFKKYERDFPDHARLMRAVARMLNKNPDMPAAAKKNYKGDPRSLYGDDRHDHGNLTLLAHSWLGGSVGVWKSVNGFSYTGLKNALEENQNIKLNDENYKFDPFDPLIGLICFAHDIGKLETFKVDEKEGKDGKGKVTYVQTRPRSDTVGAALIAKMDEFWLLPYEDRMIITLTVGNYRKPSNMPLRRDINNPNQAIALSDRIMAMLKLITEVDDEVGAIEKNTAVEAASLDPRQVTQATYADDMWDCFKALLNESFRIHHENHKFRVGQKNTMPTGTVVTLKEDVLRAELSQKLAIRRRHNETDPKLEGAAFTKLLLVILDKKGCLIREVAGVVAAPMEAVWKVDFHGKDKAKKDEVIATWPYAIMINPELYFPRMSNDQDASSTPNVVGLANLSRMADARTPRPAGPVDALVQGALEDEDGIPIVGEGTKQQKRGGGGGTRRGEDASGAAQPGTVGGPAQPGQQRAKPRPVEPTQVAATPADVSGLLPMATRPAPPPKPPAAPASTLVQEAKDEGEAAPSNVIQLPVRSQAESAERPEIEETEVPSSAVAGAPASSSGSFLDEVDPQDDVQGSQVQPEVAQQAEKGGAEAAEEEPAERTAAPAKVEERTADEAASGAPAEAAAPAAGKANLLDGLRDRLWRDAHAAPTAKGSGSGRSSEPEGDEEEARSNGSEELAPEVQSLPAEAIAVTRQLAKRLEWLAYLTRQKKIAPEVQEDGRLAYSLDAIKAHDPKMEWLTTDVLRQLALSNRCGSSAPVCFMRRREGVTLIVVNEAMVRKINS